MLSKLDWFATARGRRAICALNLSATVSIFVGKLMFNTTKLSEREEIVRFYKNGFPIRVPKLVKGRFDEVLNDMKITEEEKSKLKPFMVSRFDTYFAGAVEFKNGAIIGIPSNFRYTNESDVKDVSAQNFKKTVDWQSDGGVLFKKSLIMSDKAQKFAIAHTIARAQSYETPCGIFLGSTCILLTYLISYRVNRFLKMFEKPRSQRYLMHTGIGTLGLALYAALVIIKNTAFDWHAVREVSSMGKEYVEGGLEYYNQLLLRNQGLRELMENGEEAFTVDGEEKSLLLQINGLPLAYKKEILEKKLQEFA